MGTILNLETEDFGITVERSEELGLTISLDRREHHVEMLTVSGERALRLRDLFHAARDLIDEDTHPEYARGMAELIGNFAPEGDQFDTEHMHRELVPVSGIPDQPGDVFEAEVLGMAGLQLIRVHATADNDISYYIAGRPNRILPGWVNVNTIIRYKVA